MNDKTVDKQNFERSVSKYREISTIIWEIFKKYLPISADLITFGDDIHLLDERYKGTEEYEFMQKLLKII